jgi:hypothetical protein
MHKFQDEISILNFLSSALRALVSISLRISLPLIIMRKCPTSDDMKKYAKA